MLAFLQYQQFYSLNYHRTVIARSFANNIWLSLIFGIRCKGPLKVFCVENFRNLQNCADSTAVMQIIATRVSTRLHLIIKTIGCSSTFLSYNLMLRAHVGCFTAPCSARPR